MEKLKYERPIIKKLNTGMPNKFGLKTEYEPITEIDGVKVKDIIAEHGSPCYVISERTIRETMNEAKRAFKTRYPKVQFAWSYKTNYFASVCRIFHQEGSWGEVVSRFEYDKALANGVPGEKILFNGPDKSDDDLTVAIQNNSLLHIDHLDELYTIMEIAEKLDKKARITVRVNMDTGVYPMWDRFGFNYENGQAWDAINKIMYSNHLELIGLHSHIGTFMLSAQAYGVAASKLSDLALGVTKKFDHHIEYLDLGGGFASKNTLKGAFYPGVDTTPSFDDYAEAISTAIINSGFDPDHLPTLFLESGRALIDDAGYLLGSVLASKRLSDGRRSTIVDFGVNLLFTSFWYDHKVTPAQAFSHYTEDTIIYGPLCMNIDVIRESVTFPIMKKGDHLVVSRIGAYNMTQWMQFISLRPEVVLIDMDGKCHTIRERESLDTLTHLEKTPKHLKDIDL
jgi:diaminopimelate decarboxylase